MGHGEKYLEVTLLGEYMNRKVVLKKIAESGYNIGFGGKKHFVTYDLYRIFPRLIGIATIMVGIIQLTDLFEDFVNPYASDILSALLIIVGVLGLVIDLSSENKESYEVVGKKLLSYFNELRSMYNEVDGLIDESNLSTYNDRIKQINDEADHLSMSKQAIGTHIITHLGFFYVMQSKWVVNELKLTWKDKFPLLHWESFLLCGILFLLVVITLLSIF